MRRLLVSVLVLLVAGLPLAATVRAEEKGATHDMTVEVVSADVKAKTITIKNEKGENMTAPVLDQAVESLKTVKAGQKVILTCQDDEQGMHKGVSAIKPAKASSSD